MDNDFKVITVLFIAIYIIVCISISAIVVDIYNNEKNGLAYCKEKGFNNYKKDYSKELYPFCYDLDEKGNIIKYYIKDKI